MTTALRRDFIDPSAPGFWAFVLLFAYGLTKVVPLLVDRLLAVPVAGLVSALAWLLYAALLGWILYRLELFERRSRVTILGAFLWGAVVVVGIGVTGSPAMTGIVDGWLANPAWVPAVAAPIVEEPLKVLGVIVLAMIPGARINSVLDGLFYGLFVGLGFEVTESFLYTVNAAGSQGGALTVVVAMLILRGVVGGLWSHPAYTGISGSGVGYFASSPRSRGVRIVVFLALLLTAMLLHGLFDSPLLSATLGVAIVFKGLPVLLLLLFALRIGRRQERALFQHAVYADIDVELIDKGELETLLTKSRRRAARRVAPGSSGRRAIRRLQRAQIDLVEADLESGRDSDEFSVAAQRVRDARFRLG